MRVKLEDYPTTKFWDVTFGVQAGDCEADIVIPTNLAVTHPHSQSITFSWGNGKV
jgi:hypothetical protein